MSEHCLVSVPVDNWDRPCQVLVIEDEPGDARLIRELLREAGGTFAVQHAQRLSAGVRFLRAGGVDIVVLDLGLPDSQGLATFCEVHAASPEVPIVVLSGLEDQRLAWQAVHEGAQDYLVKGRLTAEVLGRVLRYAVERARLFRDLSEATRAREAFFAAASHDLKAPLTTIKLWAERLRALAEEPESGLLERAADRIDRLVDRSVALIEELMDVARLHAGEPLRLQQSETDLVALAQRAIDEHALRGGHDLRLVTEADAVTGCWDAARLGRVLENLLSNACKYSPEGSLVRVRVARETQGRPAVAVLEVQDQGIGIPAADLARVFERFHRAPNACGCAQGSGLGLWGAREIVERHGGSISAESQEGVGTTITVRLP